MRPQSIDIKNRKQVFQFRRRHPILSGNKTRQGYARKRILKPVGYLFLRGEN
jgi:hypothetical protein